MKKYLWIGCLAISISGYSQSDLSVGPDYHFNIQRKGSHGDAFLLHNSEFNTSFQTLKWKTSHATFGTRGIRFSYTDGVHFFADNQQSTTGLTFTPVTRFFVGNTGNVGTGTITPEAKFTISQIGNGWNDGLRINRDAANYLTLTEDGTDIRLKNWGSGGIRFFTSASEVITIKNNGAVGIGTSIPDQKLTVKGKIHAEEVIIDLSVPAPDYVFEASYDLKPLDEVKKFIDENKHLPEVPSAKEMKEDGVKVGEMEMILLKKIEELTLHAIEASQEMKAMRADYQKLIDQNVQLINEIEKLKAKQ